MSLSLNTIRKTALKFTQEFFAPTRCVYCGYYGEKFCEDCYFLLEKFSSECLVCRKPAYNYLAHQNCQDKTNLNQLIVSYKYNDIAQKLIEEFKFKFDKEIGKVIVNLINKNDSIKSLFSQNVILVPVPLYKNREKWRGFNQSEILADEFVNLYPNVKKMNVLKRIKETSQQAKLNRKNRLENVRDAFEINIEQLNQIMVKSQIILIDDITTTTSTLNECAKVLRESGFENISAIVFARGI